MAPTGSKQKVKGSTTGAMSRAGTQAQTPASEHAGSKKENPTPDGCRKEPDAEPDTRRVTELRSKLFKKIEKDCQAEEQRKKAEFFKKIEKETQAEELKKKAACDVELRTIEMMREHRKRAAVEDFDEQFISQKETRLNHQRKVKHTMLVIYLLGYLLSWRDHDLFLHERDIK
ncbi:unnamed protein product [Amoebophrya sp. A120]|nr:unnamed protein product [Amoebophrya sp. A120]|eukprot:GSA120T00024052001.1